MKDGTIKAGTGEKMQYLVHEFNDNTLRFVVRYPGRLNAHALREATKQLLFSVDILHSSFRAGRFSCFWQVHDQVPESAYFHYEETDGDPMIAASALAVLPVKPEGLSQLRCALLQGKHESAVVFSVSHLCADGSDGKYLLFQLAEAYRLFQANHSFAGLNIKNGKRDPEQLYEQLKKSEIRSLMKNPATGIKSAFPYQTEQPGFPNAVYHLIPASIMSQAHNKAKRLGATVNDLLLAAYYRAYAALPSVNEKLPISIMSMADLRRHCPSGRSEGLSNMSGAMPTALLNGVSGGFEEALAEIAIQTTRLKEAPFAGLEGVPLVHSLTRLIPMSLLLPVSAKVYNSVGIGLTNLGNINCSLLQLDELIPDAGWFGGPLKKKPAMQISAASFDGQCALAVTGQYTAEDAAALQSFLEQMAADITAYSQS